MMLEKTHESPLNCKEIQLVHPKGNQSWIFNGRTDVEAETPILWPPDVKSWLIWKDPDAGKDWRWKEKGMTEDEIVGWHHWLNGHEFEQTLGVGDGQGGLVCCSPWGHKEFDMTEQLNWTDMCTYIHIHTTPLSISCFKKLFSIHDLLLFSDQRFSEDRISVTTPLIDMTFEFWNVYELPHSTQVKSTVSSDSNFGKHLFTSNFPKKKEGLFFFVLKFINGVVKSLEVVWTKLRSYYFPS